MTRAIHASEDIWHRSVEDLLKAIEPAGAAARGPFVINLRTTTAPIGLPSKDLPHFERLQVYQLVSRLDGRPQFQLRLGIIESELEADAILATVREHYPSASKQTVDEADRAAIASAVHSPRPPGSATAASNAAAFAAPVPPKKAAVAPKIAIEPVKEFRWDIDELLPDLAKIPAAGPEQVSPNRPATRARAEREAPRPALERRRRHIPTLEPVRSEPEARRPDPSAATERQPLDAGAADSGAPQSIVTKIGTLIETVEEQRQEAKALQHPLAAPVVLAPPTASPVIDSTQTVRALASLELADSEVSQWFAIQLMLGEEPIDAEQVPNLEIFEEYPLYSVTGFNQGRLMHALRVGFFSSKGAAEAVSGYLATYFAATAIKRISIAERERFAERRVAARKDVGASGTRAIIECVGPPALPERSVDAALADTSKRSAPEAPSLWSRLTALRTRK